MKNIKENIFLIYIDYASLDGLYLKLLFGCFSDRFAVFSHSQETF